MATKKCCFAGHGDINDEQIKEKVYEQVIRLINECEVSLFQVGAYGNFDKYAAEAVRKAKAVYPHVILELVLPYLRKEEISQTFDSIIIANMPDNTPSRLKILKANEYMVNNCEFLLCYVNRTFGGASKTLEYAKKKQKTIINLA